MKEKPTVSVCMITYNHETYVSEAIEGVLKQKTDFPVELVIGEDFSNDKTRQICSAYQAKYPDKIKILPREKNLGMIANFVDALKNCTGKYIALCEGDDYWTDPLKLQKQIDFLEANPDFAVCHHLVKCLDEDKGGETHVDSDRKEITTFEDLALNNHIYTVSCVFRNNLSEAFPEWYASSPIGDYFLFLLTAQRGNIKLLREAMAVYRIHQGGAWSGANQIKRISQFIWTVQQCKEYFAPRGAKEFDVLLSNLNANKCDLAYKNRSYKEFRRYYYCYLKTKPSIGTKRFLSLTARYFSTYIYSQRSAEQTINQIKPCMF